MKKRKPQLRDFQLDTSSRVLLSVDGKMHVLPAPLAYQQAELAVSIRVGSEVIHVEGSEQTPCVDCEFPCWRAPSTPKRLSMLCTICYMKRLADEKEN
jgi:hypothetical protein